MNKDDLVLWLIKNQKTCPVCGKRLFRNMEEFDLHHLWHRRLKQIDPLLWDPINISMLCHRHHVPETAEMNYKCALQKFSMGLDPDEVVCWLRALPLKVKPGLPAFFVRAEQAYMKGERI
jgi:hypothetical protein